MTFSLTTYQEITFVIFFLYIFFDAQIYLALWVAIFYLIKILSASLSINDDEAMYTLVIVFYVVVVLTGYLYRFKNIVILNKKINGRKAAAGFDKKIQVRIGIALLLLLIINIAIIFYNRN